MRSTRALAIALLALAPSLARADAAEDTHERYEAGVAAFQNGDFAGAIAAFADVYRATGETKHLWNLAFAEYQGKRTFDALGHMRAYMAKGDANPKNLERAKAFEPELSVKITRVVLVAPDGAEVDVDGAKYGVAPLTAPIELDPDRPHVIVAKRGTDEAKQMLVALGAKTIDVKLAFPVAVPVVGGVPAAASVATPVPTAPPAPPPAPVTVAPPPPAPARIADETPPPPAHHGWPLRTWLTIGLGIGAVAAVGTGVYFAIQSNDDADNAQNIRGTFPSSSECSNPTTQYAHACTMLSNAISSQSSDYTTSLVFYGVGGALALGAVAAFLFVPHDSSPSASGYVVPMLGRDVAGAGYAGSF